MIGTFSHTILDLQDIISDTDFLIMHIFWFLSMCGVDFWVGLSKDWGWAVSGGFHMGQDCGRYKASCPGVLVNVVLEAML